MSDLLANIQNFFPWVAFIAGIGGSLHCVGMCGGLVTASCEKGKDVFRYQLGRLLGYMLLGLFGGFLGSLIQLETKDPLFALLPGLFMGILFLYWGFRSFKGKKAELPMPAFMGKFYSYLWQRLVFKNVSLSKAFFTGAISIFLPCGLLYGIVLSTLALQHPILAMFSMVFFWLGTLPSMVVAPSLAQKVLMPFKSKLPKTYAVSLIMIGLMTVSFRVMKFQENQQASGNHPHTQSAQNKEAPKMKCH